MRALESVAGWQLGAAAAAVLRAAGGPGAPVEPVGHVGDIGHPFAWASVTKLCSALAVLVACEEGTVSLSDACGPAGSTVAHLLAHASGLAPDPGRSLAAPGTRRIYSNAGYELLGAHVGERSGLGFATYLREAVLEPLAMVDARLEENGSAAHGLVGSLADLTALGAELLSPSLVHPATWQRATTVAFPGLSGVLPGFGPQSPCDWGLGPEIRGHKSPHWTGARNSARTFGHFGRAGGFLWVDPSAGTACAVLTDRPFGPWAAAAWPVLSDAVLVELGH